MTTATNSRKIQQLKTVIKMPQTSTESPEKKEYHFPLKQHIQDWNKANPDKKQMTQNNLAEDIGVTQGWLSKIQPTRHGVPEYIEIIHRLCEKFGKSFEELFPKIDKK